MQPVRVEPWLWATCSRCFERDADESLGCLTMFDLICQDAQRQGLDSGYRGFLGLAVAHDARQIRDLSDPSPILFSFGSDQQFHILSIAYLAVLVTYLGREGYMVWLTVGRSRSAVLPASPSTAIGRHFGYNMVIRYSHQLHFS